jgi:hypothetical protein
MRLNSLPFFRMNRVRWAKDEDQLGETGPETGKDEKRLGRRRGQGEEMRPWSSPWSSPFPRGCFQDTQKEYLIELTTPQTSAGMQSRI